jgi:FkbM family methyltransferase
MDEFKSALIGRAQDLKNNDLNKFSSLLARYSEHTAQISRHVFERLPADDQNVFIEWFLLRWGNISVVQPEALNAYKEAVAKFSQVEKIPTDIDGRPYVKVNFKPQGADFDLVQYDWVLGIHDIYYDQYSHGNVGVSAGDVVIDAGAFIGDTAVLFSHKTGGDCSVHSFELLDENIALIEQNLRLNRSIATDVLVNKTALSDVHGGDLWVETSTVQGATKALSGEDAGRERISTTTIDQYVRDSKLKTVDFIKMDIEGGEVPALKGSRETIQKYKPKLAICLYHVWSDPFLIPELIQSFGVDYDFGFKWVQLTKGWEAVLLAAPLVAGARSGGSVSTNAEEKVANLEAFIENMAEEYGKKYSQADTLWKNNQKAVQALTNK